VTNFRGDVVSTYANEINKIIDPTYISIIIEV